jgi:hypothetical protein
VFPCNSKHTLDCLSKGTETAGSLPHFFNESMALDVEKRAPGPTLLQKRNHWRSNERGKMMKYILLMTGTREGVDAYKAWSEKDIQTHFAYLTRMRNDLTKSGEFVATEALGMPQQAKVVRAGKGHAPITDGVFPEAKAYPGRLPAHDRLPKKRTGPPPAGNGRGDRT